VAFFFFGTVLGLPLVSLLWAITGQSLDISGWWGQGGKDVVSFTFFQAVFSASISVVMGFPGAFLIARTRFPLHRWVKAIAMIPFVIPGMIMALGMVQLLGRQGLIPGILTIFGGERKSYLYSFGAVVFAHALYNFPVTMRIVGDAWERIDGNLLDASKTDGASSLRTFRSIEIPLLITPILLSFLLSFLYCFTSFAVVLIIGGIRFSTIEVAIYQNLRVFLDFPAAVLLTVIQAGILGMFALIVFPFQKAHEQSESPSFVRKIQIPTWGWIYLCFLFIFGLSPFWSSILYGFKDFDFRWSVEGFRTLFSIDYDRFLGATQGQALFYTLVLGTIGAFLSVFFGMEIARQKRSQIQFLSVFAAGFSPVTLAFGFVALAQRIIIPDNKLFLFLPLIYAFLSFPLSYHAFRSAWNALAPGILESAYMDGARWWGLRRWILIPLFRKEIFGVGILSFVIAMGELTASLTLQSPGFSTLSIVLYRLYVSRNLLAARSMNAGLLIAILCLFLIAEWLRDPPAQGFRKKRDQLNRKLPPHSKNTEAS